MKWGILLLKGSTPLRFLLFPIGVKNTTSECPIAEKLVWPPTVISIISTVKYNDNYADIYLSSKSFNC